MWARRALLVIGVVVAVAATSCDRSDDDEVLATGDTGTTTTSSGTQIDATTTTSTASASASATASSSASAPTTAQRQAPPTTTAGNAPLRSSDVKDADRLIEMAKDDLVRRFGYDKDDIRVLGVESVVWRDSSLGCPRNDRTYDQGDVPGYRIGLQWQDVEHSYHGRDGGDPFLCQKLDG